MATTTKKKAYLVASEEGDWHYQPVEAETPEEAIYKSEPEAATSDTLNQTYYVYELTDGVPTVINTKVALVRG